MRREAREAHLGGDELWLLAAVRGGDKSLSLYSCPQMNHAGSVLSAGLAVDREANLAMYWVAK